MPFHFFPSSRRHKCKCYMLIRCWNKRTCEIFSNSKTLCPIPLNKKTRNSMCVDLGYFTGALQDFQFSTDNNVQKVLYYVSIDVLSGWKFIELVYFVLFGLYYPFTHKVSGCLLWLHPNHPMQTIIIIKKNLQIIGRENCVFVWTWGHLNPLNPKKQLPQLVRWSLEFS